MRMFLLLKKHHSLSFMVVAFVFVAAMAFLLAPFFGVTNQLYGDAYGYSFVAIFFIIPLFIGVGAILLAIDIAFTLSTGSSRILLFVRSIFYLLPLLGVLWLVFLRDFFENAYYGLQMWFK